MAGPTGPTKSAYRRGKTSAARPPAPGSGRPLPAADDPGRPPRRRLPGRLVLLLFLVLAVGLAGFGVWAFYWSSWLRVERVSVTGSQVLTEDQVRAAARIPVGTPVGSVDSAATERRLRAALPRLAEVDVVRTWPHGISLKVTERKPELVIGKAGKYVEVDNEGVRFATVAKQPKGVPLLVMEVQRSASLRHFGMPRLRREAVAVAASLPQSVARDTRTVRVRSYDSVTLELTGGRTVLWGSGERGTAKAKSLTALMKAAKEAEHFDVSVPSAPASSGS